MTDQEPMRVWSLRRRVTGRVIGLVALGWLVSIAISAVVLHVELNEMFDEELEVLVEATVLSLDAAPEGGRSRAVGVQTNDGERVLRILTGSGPQPEAPWQIAPTEGFHDAEGWRVLRRHAEGAVIEAAHALDWRNEELIEAVLSLLTLILPMIAVLVLALRRTVGGTMAPVGALADAVAARQPDDLSAIDGRALPREMQPLVSALNAHVGRIEALRQAERRFVANAAHELRTPIAATRAHLQQTVGDGAAEAVAMLDGLTRRIERLLQLSRLDSGLALGQGPADLVRILRLMLADLRDRADLRFDDADLERLSVRVDPDVLAIVLRNVLDNAVEHGTGAVSVRLTQDGVLCVENPTTQTRLYTEAFEKRAGSEGAGLGLSILASTAAASGIGLETRLDAGVARVTLRFALA
ncbi:MAG: hypothetical protein KDK01_03640 [Rhodobacteraceae bacterium]|jgi:two-component system OmpR family sensor kinase|nr:hypothetical protein [Paracoccaceae bacterium]